MSFYLSLKVQQNWENQIIKLSQPAYIQKILNKFYLNKAHAVNNLIKETALFKQKTVGKASPSEKKSYQSMIRFLIFLIIEIKPDITFAIFVASYFAKNPG